MKKNVWNNDHCRKYDTTEGFGNIDSWVNAFKQRFHAQQSNGRQIQTSSLLSSCKSLKDLKTTFNMLIKTVHPDLAGATEENIAKTQALINEYETLKAILK